MPRVRYRRVNVPMGMLVIDRRNATWALCKGKVIIDWGRVRDRPDYVQYLPGRLLSHSERYARACVDGGD